MTSSLFNEALVVLLALAWLLVPPHQRSDQWSSHAKGYQVFVSSNLVEA